MSAGTIALTNNSDVVTGTGTAFTTDLKPNDFIVVIVGGVTYTLGVKAIASATSLTLITAYGGPTAGGNAWTAVPNATLVGITAQVAADVAKAIRGLNLDKVNWQQVYSGAGNITVTLPDGSTFTGPSWNYLSTNTATKVSGAVPIVQGGTGAVNATAARANLSAATTRQLTEGSGSDPYANFTSTLDMGIRTHSNTGNTVSPWDAPSQYTVVNYFPSSANNIGTALASSWGSGNDYYLNSRNSGISGYQGWKGWAKLWHSLNTTVDSNGYIKRASPIMRLTNGGLEGMDSSFLEGFEPKGIAAVNPEAAGATSERLSTGVYLISGTLGLAESGWTVEVPQDLNGNRLIYVETSIAADMTLTVSTFKRRFDPETAMIVAGEPMDIPDGRWIDLRLNMPELK